MNKATRERLRRQHLPTHLSKRSDYRFVADVFRPESVPRVGDRTKGTGSKKARLYKYRVYAYNAGSPAKRRPDIRARNKEEARVIAKRKYPSEIVHVFVDYGQRETLRR